ncbi:MAG: orotidine 5'-phosphate decarboxylase / HUMPS family protein [Nanoarchaeota archaeon]
MTNRIIALDRSVVVACDVDLPTFERLVGETADIKGIGGYKIGPALTGRPGYDAVVAIAKKYTNKPLIYDGQKWGTDIPDTAEPILRPLRESGIETVILFPQAGPITEYEWIHTARRLGLGVIVGGEMTHPGYLEGEEISAKKDYQTIFLEELSLALTTGFIRRLAPDAMYQIAHRMGVKNFVVPGNKPASIRRIRGVIEDCGDENLNVSYFSPGFVDQGGVISEGARAAGKRFHAIVGRGITGADDMKAAALEHTRQLNAA